MNLNRTGTILLLICFIFFTDTAYSQRYSMDGGRPKKKLQFNIGKAFRKKSPEEKQKREEEKKLDRSAKYEKKAIKKYWKTYDHPEEMKSNQRVYKRMKKNLNKADRINRGKHPDNWLKRAFWPKRETKRVRDKKEQRKQKFSLFKKKKK